MGRSRHRERLLLAAFVAALLNAACAAPGPGAPPAAETLRIVLRSDPGTLDPFAASTNVARMVGTLLFEPLIEVDADLQPIPRLAVDWKLEDGGRAWQFRLRPRVRWESGGELTAEDVRSSLRRALDPRTPSLALRPLFRGAGTAEEIEPLRIRVPFDRRSPPSLLSWQRLPILPAGATGGPEPQASPPPGSGPYRLASWRRGEWLLLERNPDWWGGAPRIRHVLFRIIPDPVSSSHALRLGEVDIAPARFSDRLEAERPGARFRVVEIEPSAVYVVLWNLRRPGTPFADVRVRQALTLALNREGFARRLRRGQALAAATLYPPLWQRGRKASAPLPYDPARAERLLREAGFADSDGDGRLDRHGTPLSFPLLYVAEDEIRRDAALLLHADLAAIGVEVRLVRVDAAALVRRLREHDFAAALHAWRLSAEPSGFEFFHSSQTAAGFNYGGYSDPALDRLLEEEAEAADPRVRARVGARIEERLREEAPALFLCFPISLVGVSQRVQGFEAGPLGLLMGGPGPESWALLPDPPERIP